VTRRSVFVLSLCAVLLGTAVAVAYAPTAGFIISLVIGKRAKQKLDAVRITLKRTDYENGAAKGEPYDVIFTYRSAGKVRREWTDKEGKHVRVSDGTRMLRVDGDKKSVGAADPHLMDALWATGNDEGERSAAQDRAMAVLTAWTVSDTPVSFSRMDGRIAWVVGAQSKQLDVPQVWVDKDDLLPLRMIYPEPAKDGQKPVLVDERLIKWGSSVGGDFYPARRELYRAGALVRVDELQKVDVTPKLDEREFKIE